MVALHERGGDAASGLALARALFGQAPDVVAPQAARPCNPFQSNLRASAAYSGFSWYLGDDPSRPEAASFGDALAQLDAFVRGLRAPFAIAGEGQGAVLALTLALYAPPRLVGVFAPGARVASIAGWTPPQPEAGATAPVTDEEVDAPAWLRSLATPAGSDAHA